MSSEIDTTGPLPAGAAPDGRRGVLALLGTTTAIGSIGLAAGGTAGALLGTDLAGTAAAAGVPTALLVIGSAGGALLISRMAGRGRRGHGLMLGYLLGTLGAIVVAASAVARSLPLLLIGSTVLGTANSSVFMTRYAALEVSDGPSRGRALGTVFAATAIGAVVSPILLGPSGALAEAVGLPRLSGLYLVAVGTYGIAALLFLGASNPRVPMLGQGAYALTRGDDGARVTAATIARELRGVDMRIALFALGMTNFVMVAIMAVAPVHMMAGGQGLEMIGALIALHVMCMFGPSPVSGYLADRCGPAVVVLLGFSLLLVAGLAGMLVHQNSTLVMTGHLGILGLGWNCGVVGGSALLAAATSDPLRARVEGIGEAVMGLAAMVAAPIASVIVALGGYLTYSLVSTTITVGALIAIYHSCRESRSSAHGASHP